MKNIFLRFLRVAVTTTVGAYVSHLQNDPKYMALTPIISSIGKAIRDKYPKISPWIPF